LRRAIFSVLLVVLAQLGGCGAHVALLPVGKVTHIEIRGNNNELLSKVTDEKQILAVIAFVDAHRADWGAPWYGIPVPVVVADFYDGESFKGHLGVGPSFLETQRQGDFWSQSASRVEVKQFLALVGVNENQVFK
jgi:hypothetical protein